MKKITMHDIMIRLDVEIFQDDQHDPFTSKCRLRENSLKSNIIRSFKALNINIEKPGITGELNHWQKAKIDRNIKNLCAYVERLYLKLEKESIIDYCNNSKSDTSLRFVEDEFILILNSFYSSVTLDILWASDISVSDAYNIAIGKIDHQNLIRKLPEKFRHIEKVIIPFLKENSRYFECAKSLEDSIKSYKDKNYKGVSLLLLVTIESLVRLLGDYLIENQNLDKSLLNKKYNSLNDFLRKIPWVKDFKIDKINLMYLTGDYEFRDERNSNEIALIDFKTRLDFLRRRFKEDRDSILHGDNINFGDTWDLYMNCSALNEVYNTIKYYEILYN